MTPDWTVSADGSDITGRLRGRLVAINVSLTDRLLGDQLELVMSASGGRGLAPPAIGASIAVAMGFGATAPLGEFSVISTDRHMRTDWVRIRAAAVDLSRASAARLPRTRAWHDTTLGDVIDDIAGAHGWQTRTADGLAAVDLTHEDQTAETDLAFLTRLAAAHGALVELRAGTLTCRSPNAALTDAAPLELPAASRIRSSIRTNDRFAAAAAESTWIDLGDAAPKTAKAGSGPAQPQRWRQPTQAAAQAASAAALTLPRPPSPMAAVQCTGSPQAQPGRPLTLANWGPEFDGDWLICTALHRLSPQGYTTEVTARSRA